MSETNVNTSLVFCISVDSTYTEILTQKNPLTLVSLVKDYFSRLPRNPQTKAKL